MENENENEKDMKKKEVRVHVVQKREREREKRERKDSLHEIEEIEIFYKDEKNMDKKEDDDDKGKKEEGGRGREEGNDRLKINRWEKMHVRRRSIKSCDSVSDQCSSNSDGNMYDKNEKEKNVRKKKKKKKKRKRKKMMKMNYNYPHNNKKEMMMVRRKSIKNRDSISSQCSRYSFHSDINGNDGSGSESGSEQIDSEMYEKDENGEKNEKEIMDKSIIRYVVKKLMSIRMFTSFVVSLIVLLTGLLICFFGGNYGNVVIEGQVEDLTLLMVENIKSSTENLFLKMSKILDIFQNEINFNDKYNLNEEMDIVKMFSAFIFVENDFSFSFGFEKNGGIVSVFGKGENCEGKYVGMSRRINDSLSYVDVYTININNKLQNIEMKLEKTQTNHYDCRVRDWYQTGKNGNGEKIWSEIYVSRGGFITRSLNKAIYKNGSFIGVISSKIGYDKLSLKLVEISKSEIFIIIDEKGNFIGSNFFNYSNTVIYKLDNYPNKLFSSLSTKLLGMYGNYSNIEGRKKFSIKSEETYYVTTDVYSDDYGMKFVYIIMFSSDIFSSVLLFRTLSIIFTFVLVFFGIIISTLFVYCILHPLRVITKEIYEISQYKYVKPKRRISLQITEYRKIGKALKTLKNGLQNLQKFIPSSVLKYILTKNWNVHTKVSEAVVTVSFVDIKGFCKLTEKLDPSDLVHLLHLFFNIIEDSVKKYDGSIDKYIGDCVMIVFNRPIKIRQHAISAIRCAVNAIQTTNHKNINDQFLINKKIKLEICFGINTGKAMVGFIGSKDRICFTVLGDVVNVSSRLESFNRTVNTIILVSEESYQRSKNVFLFHYIGKINLKGKSESINAYEVVLDKKVYKDCVTKIQ